MTTVNLTALTAPDITGLTATAGVKSITMEFTDPDVTDFRRVEIWARKTTNDRSGASLVGTSLGTTFTHQGLTTGDTWYYWIRTVSIYGRADGNWYPSSATAGVSATTTDVAASDLDSDILTYSSSVSGSSNGVGTTHTTSAYATWESVFTSGNIAPAAGTQIDFDAMIMLDWSSTISTGTGEGFLRWRIRNTTDSTDILVYGDDSFPVAEFDTNGVVYAQRIVNFSGKFTVVSGKTYQLQCHVKKTRSDAGSTINWLTENYHYRYNGKSTS